jgi:hypothetical protein
MDRLVIYRLLMYGVCGYALIRGRPDARIVGLVFLIGDLATLALRSRFTAGYLGLETNVLIVDVLALVAFTYAALISDRFWPLWVSGLQLTSSMGHVFKLIDPHLLPLAYAAALRFWAYPILIILAVGTWRAQRRANRETASVAF